MSKFLSFETERLLLKPTQEDDSSFILELVNSPKWIKYVGDRNIHSKQDANTYIKTKILPQLSRLGFSNYTVVLKSNNTKIGSCGLYDREGIDGVDLGFAFLPEYERMGFAFEASSKIISLAFSKFALNKISAITTRNNLSSQNLLNKLGFVLLGTTNIPNDSEDLLLYELTNPK